uniref:Uncharacterized protein n=1 Tax=Anguilla anguilla TaxID=7936 RepID=A0A0E9XHP8_ANGAN
MFVIGHFSRLFWTLLEAQSIVEKGVGGSLMMPLATPPNSNHIFACGGNNSEPGNSESDLTDRIHQISKTDF